MTHYTTTTLISINFSLSSYTAFLTQENSLHNDTFNNVSTTLELLGKLPPDSPYTFSQKIFIAILFVILSLLTVIGNFMVRSCRQLN